jgi:glycosyltransferase involved in cell wall biosynthesis
MLHIYRQITGIRKFRSVVFAQKRENADRFPFDEIIIIPKPATHALRRFWVKQIRRAPVQIYRGEARRIAAELKRANAALMHIYFGHIAVQLLPLIEIAPVPIVVSFHGADAMVDMDKPAYRAATQRMLGLARLVLVRSESLAQRLTDLGCAREKIRIHRTGIPLGEFRFVPRAAPADGAWKFVQACRLIPKKGLRTSLRAFAEFAKTFPRASCAIAGEGPMLEELKAFARELGIDSNVRFTGFLSQDELRALYRESHVFLHPSELGGDGNQEGVPNSMLEAMATGLPALATTHGGIPEAVESGVSGFLIGERDHDALARAMFDLAADARLYANMSAAAARAVGEKFEQQAQVRVLESIYNEAISQHSASRL